MKPTPTCIVTMKGDFVCMYIHSLAWGAREPHLIMTNSAILYCDCKPHETFDSCRLLKIKPNVQDWFSLQRYTTDSCNDLTLVTGQPLASQRNHMGLLPPVIGWPSLP